MAGEDFITIQLSAAGVEFAGAGGVVAIRNSRREFEFHAGQPQKVLRAYEWSHILSPMMVGADPMFDVAPAVGSVALPIELVPASSTTAPESLAHEGQAL
jgi:hypothetical protein